MTDRLHLPLRHRRILEGLLRKHVPEAEVWAYGSRITGESHEGSDLDLVVRGPDLKPLDDGFFDLLEAIEQSNIPILVQAHDWARLPENFHQEIERDYVVVQNTGEKKTPAGEWRELPFSEAVTINPTVQLDRGTVYPYVEMAAVNSDSRIANSLEKREFKGSGSKFQTDDTLMARITPCLENGKIARFQPQDNGHSAHGSTEFIVIRGRPGVTDNDFAYYLTRSEEVRNYAIGQMTGTSGRQRVPVDSLDRLIISIPSLPDQREIARILGTLDDKIELNRRMNETLEEMARALFKSWFVDFEPVRAKAALASPPSDKSDWTVDRARAYLDSMDNRVIDLFPDKLVESELGEIPEGWEVKRLAESFRLTMGQSPPGSTYNEIGKGLPFFQGNADFEFRYPKRRKYCTEPTRIADRNDTLVSVRAPAGAINMAWEECCIGRGVAALRHLSGSTSFTYYSAWALQKEIQQYEHTGTVFGAINKKQFESMNVIQPGGELIDAFGSRIQPLDERIRSNESSARNLADQRDVLLPKLVSGRLQINQSKEHMSTMGHCVPGYSLTVASHQVAFLILRSIREFVETRRSVSSE